jgi:hypothetical protein
MFFDRHPARKCGESGLCYLLRPSTHHRASSPKRERFDLIIHGIFLVPRRETLRLLLGHVHEIARR